MNPANREKRHSHWQQIVRDEEEWWEEKINPKPKVPEMAPWNSSKCAVMGLASGYNFNIYQRKCILCYLCGFGATVSYFMLLTYVLMMPIEFVGSLRATGYSGHIILGVNKDVPAEVVKYFKEHNVSREQSNTCPNFIIIWSNLMHWRYVVGY